MANELPNAVALMSDQPFRDWVKGAAAYQARVVLTEATSVADHDVRLRMATAVMLNPSLHLEQMVNVIATDPTVSVVGVTVGSGANLVGQTLLLQKMNDIWTPLAKLLYPIPVP